MDWHTHIQTMRPHVVRVTTPGSSGTGFIVRSHDQVIQIITAAHVVRDAHAWEQSITVHHSAFEGGSVQLTPDIEKRVVFHNFLDSACLGFALPNLIGNAFPEEPIELVPPGETIKEGVEVGWLGYPYLAPGGTLCFFSGHISARLEGRYFVDGVAVHGVSGGPAFYFDLGSTSDNIPARLRILGSITAYSPDRASRDVLPGLMVADNASWVAGLQR